MLTNEFELCDPLTADKVGNPLTAEMANPLATENIHIDPLATEHIHINPLAADKVDSTC